MGGIIGGRDVLVSVEGKGGKVESGDVPRGLASLIPLTAAWVSPLRKPTPLWVVVLRLFGALFMKVDICETGVGWTEKLTLPMDRRDENRAMGSGTADIDHSTTDKGSTRATTTSVNCWLGR